VPATADVPATGGGSTEDPKPGTAPVQHAAATIAGVFGLVGLLGFLPGFTSDLGAIEFAGPHSDALLFGVFSVSVLHNVIHLLYAVVGLTFATASRLARWYLFGGGTVYLLLALHSLLVEEHSSANVVPLNAADGWLHLSFGVVMIALGFLPARRD
jgi:hypothetical protein